ncbi:MAG: UvrD-helicase domain-containing protein [Bacteroidales bacterium]|nr:UvrD-helicase domain-containing protein [Bacteroidales bacterium]
MNILFYNDIDNSRVKKQFEKTVDFLKKNDFNSAEIKKLAIKGYYRAKLDYENRLLFKFAKYNKQTYILLLEVILNHEYEKSRFLRGAKIDENKLIPLKSEKHIPDDEIVELNFINNKNKQFHLLNKVISFDDIQQNIFNVKPPVVIIGSAGSGKTVLTLEKIKSLKGNVLYITLSSFLVENSAKLYYSDNYFNEKQDVDFLSFKEYLDTLKIISGKELDFKSFNNWLQPRKQSFGIKDSNKLFEEFRGVITGVDITKEFQSKKDYINLGIKQSIFLNNDREKVYEAFVKYLEFLTENNFYDLNIISYQWLKYSRAKYDFIVIDEVQDFTNIQLYLILKSLKTQGNFILCGDSNQIVHPNFFSWTNVKTMFYKHDISGGDIKVLHTNYRNSVNITGIANKLLMIKNARFGSIDKESTYLVKSLDENKGIVNFYSDSTKIRKQLNDKTARSTKYAVLVMTQEYKAVARKIFKTPLLFSIHEAKGLEYDNIILVDFISKNGREFNQITQGINKNDLKNEDIAFSRGRDKADKSLDAYKFYINSLYVGITRAIKNLYIVETSRKHEILSLLDLVETKQQVNITEEVSSLDDWKEEARKLELQGKKEQAEEIKKTILEEQKPDWEPITNDNIGELKIKALDPDNFNKKAKDTLFAYALLYNDNNSIKKLAELKYRKAEHPEYERNSINRKYYIDYNSDNLKNVEQKIRKFGIDYRDQFNLTPLLAAIETGSIKILKFLLEHNAKTDVTDNIGRNPLRISLNRFYFLPHLKMLKELHSSLLTDNIRIKVNDRMVKIPNRKMEYFLLNVFMVLQDTIINDHRKGFEEKGVKAGDIVKVVENYSEIFLPDYRKKRTYISSVLAKNEVDGSNPYNNALFIRVDRGFYCINPEVSILNENKWINIYDFTGLNKTKKLTQAEKDEKNAERLIEDLKKVRKMFPEDAEKYTELIEMNEIARQEALMRQGSKKAKKQYEKLIAKKKEEAQQREEKIKKLEENRLRKMKEKEEKRRIEEEKLRKADESQLKLPF